MDAERSRSGIVNLARRRARLVVALTLGAATLASVVSFFRPKVYRAEARLLAGAVGGLEGVEYAQRVDGVAQELRNLKTIDEIVRRLGYDQRFADLPETEMGIRREALVQELGARSTIEVRRPESIGAFELYFAHDGTSPDEAQQMTSELVRYCQNLVYDLPLAEQREEVEARRGVRDEATRGVERALAVKAEYEQANSEFLEGAERKLADVRKQIRQLEEQTVGGLEKRKQELAGLVEKEPKFKTSKEKDVDPQRLAALDERIRDVTERIAVLTGVDKKPETHDDVVAQREMLRRLEAEKKRLYDEAAVVERSEASEMYASLVKDLRDAENRLEVAKRQLRHLREQEREQGELCRKTPEIRLRAKELGEAVEAARAVEKAADGRVAEAETELRRLEKQGTLLVRPLEIPERPQRPSGPGPATMALAGVLAGLLCGLSFGFAFDRMDPSFRDVESVAVALGVPTLGVTQRIETPAETDARRSAARRAVVALAAFGVIAAACTALSLFTDLDGVREFVSTVAG